MENWSLSPVPSLSGRVMEVRQMSPNTDKYKQTIDRLVIHSVQSLRLMHIGFGAFSIALALLITIRILYDSWRATQLQVQLRQRRWAWLTDIHPAEVFPLVISIATVIQQTIFIGVQSSALKSARVSGCDQSAQLVFPSIFILGYLNLVFGFEATLRAFKSPRLAPRKAWAVRVCLAAFGILMIFTWLPTTINKTHHRCFGDLVWRVGNHSVFALSILSILTVSFTIMATILALRLVRTVNIEPNERIAASRMVYHLVTSILTNVLVLFFFATVVTRHVHMAVAASRVSNFVLFASGILISITHIFLRANALRTAIKPVQTNWSARRRFRLFGPSDLEIMNISSPVNLLGPREVEWYNADEEKRMHGELRFASTRETEARYDFRSPRMEETPGSAAPSYSAGASKSPQQTFHKKSIASYSLFPATEDAPRLPAAVYSSSVTGRQLQSTTFQARPFLVVDNHPTSQSSVSTPITGPLPLLQPKTYSPTGIQQQEFGDSLLLQPPLPLFSNLSHRRESSLSSSGTLQIGLRVSNLPMTVPVSEGSALAPSGLGAAFRPYIEVQTPNEVSLGNNDRQISTRRTSFTTQPDEAADLLSPVQLLQQRQRDRLRKKASASTEPNNTASPVQSQSGVESSYIRPLNSTFRALPGDKSLPPTPTYDPSSPTAALTPVRSLGDSQIGIAISSSVAVGSRSPAPGFF